MPQHKVGQNIYVFSAGSDSSGRSRDCMITAHGLKITSGNQTEFRVPSGLEIVFYGEDNRFLNDPGVASVGFGHLLPYESYPKIIETASSVENIPDCPNYELSKYQGYHGSSSVLPDWMQGGFYRQRRGVEDKEWETYTQLNLLVAAEEDPIIQEQLLALEQQIEHQKGIVKFNREKLAQVDMNNMAKAALTFKLLTASKKDLANIESRARLVENSLKKNSMDIVSIRNRKDPRYSRTMTLAKVIDELRSAGWNYEKIHCSFCRGSISDAIADTLHEWSKKSFFQRIGLGNMGDNRSVDATRK